MKLASSHSHRSARELLDANGLRAEIIAAVDAPELPVVAGGSQTIKQSIAQALAKKGWASPIMVENSLDLEINFGKGTCFVQVQTGNIARAFYDLMKLQSLFDQKRADCAVLVVPTAKASRILGGNLAQFERVKQELEVAFYHQIGVPIYLIAFE